MPNISAGSHSFDLKKPPMNRLFETSTQKKPIKQLKLLSYNIQVGVASSRYRHYLTHSWKHFLPHAKSLDNLEHIAHMISEFDLVALQEVDAGSIRSHDINQIEYLAQRGHFPFWHYQTNRNLGRIAQNSNGFLARIRPTKVEEHKLPGVIRGRGAIMIHYGCSEQPVVIVVAHLALGKRTRQLQIDYLSELIQGYEHAIVMGDLNCQANSSEMDNLLKKTHLCTPEVQPKTFPSWRPTRSLDHILVTPSLHSGQLEVIDFNMSDHLPVAVVVNIPETVKI